MRETSLRPMGIGAIIDSTFKLYRNNFKAIILFALLIGGTANLIIYILRMGTGIFQADSSFNTIYSGIMGGESIEDLLYNFQSAFEPESVILGILSNILSLLVTVFITPLITGGVTLITLSACRVRNDEGIEFFPQTGKIYWKLVVTQLVMFLVGLILYLVLLIPIVAVVVAITVSSAVSSGPGFVYIIITIVIVLAVLFALVCAIPFFALMFPAAIQENRFYFKAVGRAWQLFRRRFWKSIGLMLLIWLLVSVLSTTIGLIAGIFPPLLDTILTVAVSALLTPVPVIAATLLYLDIRMTAEGYDLELRASAMKAPAVAEAPISVTSATGTGPVEITNTEKIAVPAESLESAENTENTDD